MTPSFAGAFLDEADANLSGEESAGWHTSCVNYPKIPDFCHLPPAATSLRGKQPFFGLKKANKKSVVSKIADEKRVTEIARMVSSGEINQKEAMEYAKKMLDTAGGDR